MISLLVLLESLVSHSLVEAEFLKRRYLVSHVLRVQYKNYWIRMSACCKNGHATGHFRK